MAMVLKSDKVVFVLVVALSSTALGILAQETQNVITRIINQTQISCASDLFNKAMYISPQLKKVQDSENLVENGIWENDDWILKNSSNMRSSVDDKRWEDFSTTKTNYKHFDQLNTSISFSVNGTHQITFFADDGESLDYFEQFINNLEEWTTFDIFFEDGNIHYYMNNNWFRSYPLKPNHVVAKTESEADFRIHEYKYKEATDTNPENNPTSLIIPPSEKSYLILYISLCTSCVLEVEYGGDTYNIVSNQDKTNILEQWQAYPIKLNSSVTNKINFIRKKDDQAEKGYWKLDARLYNNENNIVTYKIDTLLNDPEKRYYCNYLHASNNSTQTRSRRSVDTAGESQHITDCTSGMVGPKCDISCENVLGHEYPMCQKHKICNSEKCQCAWGYQGSQCYKECVNGWWGINCQQECQNCQACNKQTGKCTNIQGSNANWQWWATVVLLVMLIANTAVGDYYAVLHFRSRKYRGVPVAETECQPEVA